MYHTLFRAQHVLHGSAINKNYGLAALKKNQKWFGNNPKASRIVGKAKVPIEAFSRVLPCIFEEEKE